MSLWIIIIKILLLKMSRSCYIYRLAALMVLALVFTACFGLEEHTVSTRNMTEYPVVLHAGTYPESRISVNDASLSWEENDKLKITALNDTLAVSELSVYEIDAQDPSNASFTGFVTMKEAPEYCYFTYPSASSASVIPENGRVKFQYNMQSGRHEPFMYARLAYDPQGMSVAMKHAGAVLEVDVDIPEVSTITFAGNNLESVYPLEIDPATGEIFMTSSVGLQISVPVQTEGKTYICVPPVNFSMGFSLILSKADGSYMVKSFSAGGQNAGYDFSQKVGSIIPLTVSGTFEGFSIRAESLSYEHTKNNGLLTGTDVTFNMFKSGTPNKVVQEWGANLLDLNGNIVRSISSMTPISGQSVSMECKNNCKLLPAGTYVFSPYYRMYGKLNTLESKTIEVADPGVQVVMNGQTSYDKYLANTTADAANSHANTLIEGVSVSTNLDLSIIDARTVTLDGASLGDGTWSSGTISYGNLTKTTYKSYPFKATIVVGNLTFEASRDFHITGLPYTGDFATGNPTGWTPAWGFLSAKYSDARVVFNTTAAIRTPKFHVPASATIKVVTYSDCRHNVTSNSNSTNIYIATCAAGAASVPTAEATLTLGSDYYQVAGSFGNVSGFKRIGYLICNTALTLTPSKPALIFSTSMGNSFLGSNTLVSFGHKIEYSK